jgi:hypothetical protein
MMVLMAKDDGGGQSTHGGGEGSCYNEAQYAEKINVRNGRVACLFRNPNEQPNVSSSSGRGTMAKA